MAEHAYSGARPRAEAPHPLPPFRLSQPVAPDCAADARLRLTA